LRSRIDSFTVLKITALAVVVLVAVLVAKLAVSFWQFHSIGNGYSQLEPGVSAETVVSLRGQPDEVLPGERVKVLTWDGENRRKNVGECQKAYKYLSPLPFLYPDWWVVCFDQEGKVISKAYYQSA
jgi:hypothetical protein